MRLEEVCKVFTDGDWIESKDQSESGIRLVQTGNVGEGKYLEKADRAKYISVETFERLKCTEIYPGDVLVSRLPEPVGRACIIPAEKTERMITAVDCTICRPDECKILKEYLCYFMQSEAYYSRLMSNVTGTTRKRISRKNLGNVELDVPDKGIQAEVVKRLDLLTRIIDCRCEELEKMDELIKARFVEMFGDRYAEDTLLNLCNIIDYRGKTPEKVESGLPFITAKNIKMHQMNLEPREYIAKETYDKVMVRGFPKEGDVVFTTEAPLGNVCRIPHFDTEFYIGQRIVTLQTEKLIPAYLEYAVSTDEFKRKYMGKSSGSTVTGIRVRLLEQLTIPVPPVELQKRFEAFVSQVDKSKAVVQASLDETQLLFDSLMQEYFG